MDKSLRNTLRNAVTQCRRLLEEAVAELLQGQFGVHPSGKIEDAARMSHLSPEDQAYRSQILVHLGHIEAGGKGLGAGKQKKPAPSAQPLARSPESIAHLIREVAFTHLNRLAAYKMMETRGLIREAVSRGLKSQGFLFYLAGHPEDEQLWSSGQQDVAYRHFLAWLGSTLSEEIGVLFLPHDPADRLLPPQRVLDQVLDLLNSEELAEIWDEDETIGWIYQYFTPKELRDQARKESQAPRNSYELAFRNQFYTPRYVVQFLTDNTLGRIWYEMRQGNTALAEQCQYVVRRPNEIFLGPGETPPATAESGQGTPSGEMEKQKSTQHAIRNTDDQSPISNLQSPVYIPYRAKKDPRELKILDPASGSGHFLLYCFDLLETIYEEAYADPDLGPALHADYPTLADLKKAVPGLILRHNLHGIDIDLRAVQIASLALWLRAQKSLAAVLGPLSLDRLSTPSTLHTPRITRANLVCAEPMPGSQELLEEFIADLHPPVLGQLVRAIFHKMELAGEAGSLLKIEEEIQDAVAAAKKQWLAGPKAEQLSLWPEDKQPQAEQLTLFDLSGVTDEAFWEEAEGRVLEALHEYAKQALNGKELARQLFAEDAVQGFAFIELCQRQYDVVLMNPPFGEVSVIARNYLYQAIPIAAQDIFAAFVDRGAGWLDPSGKLGALTGRLGFYKNWLEDWRVQFYGYPYILRLMADLGYGVLDDAVVEAAAYIIERHFQFDTEALFFNELDQRDKQASLIYDVQNIYNSLATGRASVIDVALFRSLPNSTVPHWCQPTWIKRFAEAKPMKPDVYEVKLGLASGDDFRYLRLVWELKPSDIRPLEGWTWCAKGGEYEPYYGHMHLVFNWPDLQNARRTTSSEYFGLAGITYTQRTTSNFSARVLPAKCIMSYGGPGIYPSSGLSIYGLVALLNSAPYQFLIEMVVGGGDTSQSGTAARNIMPSLLESLPSPDQPQELLLDLENYGRRLYELSYIDRCDDETREFFYSPILITPVSTLFELAEAEFRKHEDRVVEAVSLAEKVDEIVSRKMELGQREIEEAQQQTGRPFPKNSAKVDRVDQIRTYLELGRVSIHSNSDAQPMSRAIVKRCSVIDDLLETICHVENISIDSLVDLRRKFIEIPSWYTAKIAMNIVSYMVGCVFGRWDLRCAIRDASFELPDAIAPIAASAPGMLIGSDNSPLTDVPDGYPVGVDWNGLLVDDPDHPDDVVRRVREVLDLLWGERAEAIEREACDILGVGELRDYFRKPGSGGFWDDHVKRYSKSRRKAPIYWLLQSEKKNYTLWLYYHRLDKDILFKALVNYVEPKLRLEEGKLEGLRARRAALGTSGREARGLERDLDHQEAFLTELHDFHDKLRRAAELHLEPDLNDGVVLNIAPLWELVPWKEAQKYWEELLAGKYEWSSVGKQLRERAVVGG